jgi:hypothetical protein
MLHYTYIAFLVLQKLVVAMIVNEIEAILRNPKFRYHVHKSPKNVPVMSPPPHPHTHTLQCTTMSSQRSPSSRFSKQNPSLPPCHMLRRSPYPSLFGCANNVCRREILMTVTSVQIHSFCVTKNYFLLIQTKFWRSTACRPSATGYSTHTQPEVLSCFCNCTWNEVTSLFDTHVTSLVRKHVVT